MRYQRSEQALLLALMAMVVNGVSTRKVSQITEEFCGTKFSSSTVSELCDNLDPIIEAWLNRRLSDDRYPFLLVDATPNSLKDEVHPYLQAILEGPVEDKAPKAMSILETRFNDAAAVLLLPEKYRQRLRTTNSIERLNEEIRRREPATCIFPNRESVIRLARRLAHGEKMRNGPQARNILT